MALRKETLEFLNLPLKERQRILEQIRQQFEATMKERKKYEAGWRERYRDHVFQAMLLREEGRNKEALAALDEAYRAFMLLGPDVDLSRKPGRPPKAKNKRPDCDDWTLQYMRWMSKETGVTQAEALAKDASTMIGFLPRIHRGASNTAFIKRVSAKYRRFAKK